jgi:hypothetical protein
VDPQLVSPTARIVAAFKAAHVRFLTGVRPLMGTQAAGVSASKVAAGEAANVGLLARVRP